MGEEAWASGEKVEEGGGCGGGGAHAGAAGRSGGEREQSGREEEACEREQSWTRWATGRERRWGWQVGERMRVYVGVSAVVLVGL